MGWVIALSVTLEIILIPFCALALAIFAEGNYQYNLVDEQLLHYLTIMKLIAGPVSFALLIFKKRWGMIFTAAVFFVYLAGVAVMPFLNPHPMAYWHNMRMVGQGPVYGAFYLALGALLLKYSVPPSAQISASPSR